LIRVADAQVDDVSPGGQRGFFLLVDLAKR
jgi:hypothetical protein